MTAPTGLRNEVYRDAAADWRWRHFAANGAETFASSEGYANYAHAIVQAVDAYPSSPTWILRSGAWSKAREAEPTVTVHGLDEALQAEIDAAWTDAGGTIADGVWSIDADGIGDTFCPELAQRIVDRLGAEA